VKYSTIVADPPWDVAAGPRSLHDAGERTRKLTYPTMTVEAISALRPPAATDAHLYIWTINKYVEQTYEIAREWGFAPSTLLVWVKSPKGRGLGGTFSTAAEYVLFCRRGALAATGRVERNWWQWKRGVHSAKPEAFLDIVEQVSPGPYLEMFARRNRLGWDTWGTESLAHAEVDAA
jgi:N6-adenosine-specific RNA methylase IME4